MCGQLAASVYNKRWREKNRKNGRCVNHPNEIPLLGRPRCQRCLDNYKRHWEKHGRSRQSIRWRAIYEMAKKTVAEKYGRPIECMWDTLPIGNPLREHKCEGRLEIDHVNGDGYKEHRENWFGSFCPAIVTGARSTDDLRLLCLLHQLWNRI